MGLRKREPWLDLKRGVSPSAGESSVYLAAHGPTSEGMFTSGVRLSEIFDRPSVIDFGCGEAELNRGDLKERFLLAFNFFFNAVLVTISFLVGLLRLTG